MSMLESCQRIDDQEKLLKSRLKTRIYILNIWFQNMEDARMQDFRGGGISYLRTILLQVYNYLAAGAIYNISCAYDMIYNYGLFCREKLSG